MKTCSQCQRSEPQIRFHKDRSHSDGKQTYCAECNAQVRRKYLEQSRDSRRRAERAYRQRWPERHRARYRLKYAVKTGKLKRGPCQVCGAEPAQAHHHRGYAPEFALDVAWLCVQHHREADRLTETFHFARP